jgi:hypothetical protein
MATAPIATAPIATGPIVAPLIAGYVSPASAPSVDSTARSQHHHHHHPQRHVEPAVLATPAPVTAAPNEAAEAAVAEVIRDDVEAPAQQGPRSLDDLLVAATVQHVSAPAPTGPHQIPTHAELAHALEAVRSSVAACTQVHDVALVRLTFRGSTGRPTAVTVEGRFASTTAGSCMATAVRGVHVEPFQQSAFSYAHPFHL